MRLKPIAKIIVFLIFISTLAIIGYNSIDLLSLDKKTMYLGSVDSTVALYDSKYMKIDKAYIGDKVVVLQNTVDKIYSKVSINNKTYYVKKDNIVEKLEDSVMVKTLYVRTPLTIYNDTNSNEILGFIKKGSELSIVGYNNLIDGVPEMYKVNYGELTGYVYSKYLVNNIDDANKLYKTDGINSNALNLDYYPYEKVNFEDNKMPSEVRALYLNGGVIDDIDKYIEIAKTSGINAFVIDIKENTYPTYKSEVMKKYTMTTYDKATRSSDSMKKIIDKLHDNNIYAIARIVVAKDTFYANDNLDDVIWDKSTDSKYLHNGSVWVSLFSRRVWEYNVSLAIDAIDNIGFNEIQFDYLRFPDSSRTDLDFRNKYDESKSQGIQDYLFYATDMIHNHNAYISADLFGESAHGYITTYGQYWASISNIVDVVSGMPYPELFASGEYGINRPWNEPYNTLTSWGKYVLKQQKIIDTPAIVRTWIEAYTPKWRKDYIEYTSIEVSSEIQALYDLGFKNGFIAWNGSSSKEAYTSYKDAFKKEY